MDKKVRIKQAVDKLFKNNAQNYIFIYTPTKVGSTSLVSSLRISLNKNYSVIHIHDEEMLSVLTGIKDVTIGEIINYISKQNKTVYVFDVYRSPIERKMSEFFEKLSAFHFNNTEENINNYGVNRIINRFNKVFPHIANGDHYFEKYNINYPITFDFNKKYTIQTISNIKFVKLRLCDSHIWSNILSEILQKEIVLVNDYQTNDKKIGDLYKKFKEAYNLPVNFFDLIRDCKYFNFYYSEEERNAYFNKWAPKTYMTVKYYTVSEYQFYKQLYLENQYYNYIQTEHYIDSGCFCKACFIKRTQLFHKAKKGEKINEKIIHSEAVKEIIQQKANQINEFNKKIEEHIMAKNNNKKVFFKLI